MLKDKIVNRDVLIDVREFDDKPGPFCMSFGFDITNIAESIKSVGLINKPYIRRTRSAGIDIITGYRRILALMSLNWKKIPCVEIVEPMPTDIDLLNLNIYDNICTRRFNLVEKGMILSRLKAHLIMEDIYSSYLGLLDISSRREADLLIKIESLDEVEKRIIAEETFSLKTIESLLDFDVNMRGLLLKWISNLKLNINQQILFIEYINDISIAEGKDICELLVKKPIADLYIDDSKNTPQRAKRLIEILRERRYPVLTSNEKIFAGHISSLGLPKNVRLKHSQYFENPDYILEISFKDGKILKDTIDSLAGIKGIKEIKDPWKV